MNALVISPPKGEKGFSWILALAKSLENPIEEILPWI